MPEIKVTIAQDGTTKITTKGFTGTACQDATKAIEKALGAVTSEKLTGEFYEKNDAHIHISNGSPS